MEVLGISLTPGHLIIAGLLVVLYDAIWTWAASNKAAAWWFERVQGWLKLAIYSGFLGLVALFVFTPWPWNLILVLAVVACGFFIYMWLHNRPS